MSRAASVFLHGFTGTPACWDEVRARLGGPSLAPAALGHGAAAPFADSLSAAPSADRFSAEVDRLAAIVEHADLPRPLHLCGYSLGARLGLGLLVRHPGLFARATLIGVHPGLTDPDERAARASADDAWAAAIARDGLAAFVAAWEAQPLFASQSRLPAPVRAAQRERRLRHDPAGLAAALRTLSLGRMPCYRPALPDLHLPVTLIAGAEDPKFLALAYGIEASLPRARVRAVPAAGHNVVIEAPAALCAALQEE